MTQPEQNAHAPDGQPAEDPSPVAHNHIELHLPSVLGYEKIARRAAEAVAEQMDFDPARIEDLKTAVAEACMNAIEHGNRLDRQMTVVVLMTIDDDRLEVCVADVGLQPFPDTLPAPGTDQRTWGMFFIKRLMDEVEIVRLPEGGTQVRMVLYLSPEAAAAGRGSEAESSAETAPATDVGTGTVPAPADSPEPGEPPATAKGGTDPAAGVESGMSSSAEDQAGVAPSAALVPVEDSPKAIQPIPDAPKAIQPVADLPEPVQPTPPAERATSEDDGETPADEVTSSAAATPAPDDSAPPQES